ncbi:replication fork protection component Swi3-domain-containing protein [Xylaria palmicola]|nr:replication fork protection component Swi3-domain-containing protein [Xylaria palmicola]
MATRLASRPSAARSAPPAQPLHDIDNYDVDDDPFADSGDDAAQKNGKTDGQSQSRKRKDASGLGIDEAVSVTKKPRVPRVKLDEARLLSDNGIPKLRRKARHLKFKGKGHEFSDGARLLSFYQDWLDDLFPKAKFLDALSMVEKAGHKNQLKLRRIQWIDEGRPRPAGDDGDNDALDGPDQTEERDPAIFPARVAPIFQSSAAARTKTPAADDPFADEDIYDASPRRPTATAPSIASVFRSGQGAQAQGEPDEDTLDALMAEEEAQRSTSTSIFGNGQGAQRTQVQRSQDDDDDDLDALMAEAEAESSAARGPSVGNANHRRAKRAIIEDDEDDEDDLDALMAEAEVDDTMTANKPLPPEPATAKAAEQMATHGVDEDEEAAMAEMDGLW